MATNERAVAQSARDANRGRQRAQRLFAADACTACGTEGGRLERHHIDANPLNNDRANVQVLCTRCHMIADGRLAIAQERIREIQPRGAAARTKWKGCKCAVDACLLPAKYRGLCNAHYYRARANGGNPGTAPVRSYRRAS